MAETMNNSNDDFEKQIADLKDQLKNIIMQQGAKSVSDSEKEEIVRFLSLQMTALSKIASDVGLNIEELFVQAMSSLVNKKVPERFIQQFTDLKQFFDNGYVVLNGTPNTFLYQLEKYIRHAERLWGNAAALFQLGSFSTSCFLSIVCIEECSKISLGKFQYFASVLNKETKVAQKARGKNPLNQHTKKHFIAACSGALVNNRMDRLLGIEKVSGFIDDCASGKLEILRQKCLYVDMNKEGTISVPHEIISDKEALFFVCLAGELLSSIEGAESLDGGFQEKLDKFESEYLTTLPPPPPPSATPSPTYYSGKQYSSA